jgi:small nuclear ribonucleoprotein (snRNP)-like protein
MRITALALIVSLFTLATGNASAQTNIEWHNVASSIPLGSKVKVQMLDGKRVSGTLVGVNDTSVQVKRNARRPEAATIVAFDQISNLEKDNGGGMSWGKAIGIGLGVGVGAILTVFVIALQLD